MGGDVRSLQDKLTGGKGLYGAGIVHTDRKQDNILFDTELTQDDIEALVEADPSRYVPPTRAELAQLGLHLARPRERVNCCELCAISS